MNDVNLYRQLSRHAAFQPDRQKWFYCNATYCISHARFKFLLFFSGRKNGLLRKIRSHKNFFVKAIDAGSCEESTESASEIRFGIGFQTNQ